jgi:hypothetical protein
MQVAKLTAVQAAIINGARANSSVDERKQIKREVFSVVKAKFGIPADYKLSANTTGADQKGYLILHVAGKRNYNRGKAFRLGADGKFDGTLVTRDELFPPPVVEAPAAAPASSVFGGSPSGSWFRLDPADLRDALTDVTQADGATGGPLPTPHLMLAGTDAFAITADGSIYQKVS